MDYIRIYNALIDRGKKKVRNTKRVSGFDRHRIVPGHKGGTYKLEIFYEFQKKNIISGQTLERLIKDELE